MCIEKKVEECDHILVEARLKLVCGWRSAGRMEGARNVLKVSELNKKECDRTSTSRKLAWKI